MLESVEQAIAIAEGAGVPLHISHLKGIDKRGSAQIDGALAAIANARARGLDVTADAYPYLAGATQLLSFLGPEVMHDGVEGALALLRDPVSRRAIKEHMHDDFPTWENYLHTVGWDQIQIATVDDPNCKQFCGKTIAQAAEMMGLAPDDAALELLNQNNGTMVIFAHYMYLEDVLKIYRQPYTFVASDSMYLVNGLPHPRLYGTFARILELVRTQPGMVSLEEAVRKMTSFPARRFNLADRGLLRPGLKADITVFDAETVCDNTSYLEPRCYPGGIEHVFVSGVPVIENGAFTGRTPGKMLRG